MIHFISDLHLSASHPETLAAFGRYMGGPARQAQSLYVLGDLFDAWPGDDALNDPGAAQVARALADLSGSGVQVFFMAGNRDFLVDKGFAEAARLTLIDEPFIISLGGQPYVLMHGDALCTDDVAYQRFRSMVRNPAWRAAFLAKPLQERLAIAADARQQSEQSKQEKAAEIMDVNQDAVSAQLRALGGPHLIHGHTHRPAKHEFELDRRLCQRWVLHDWHARAEWLEWTEADGLRFRSL